MCISVIQFAWICAHICRWLFLKYVVTFLVAVLLCCKYTIVAVYYELFILPRFLCRCAHIPTFRVFYVISYVQLFSIGMKRRGSSAVTYLVRVWTTLKSNLATRSVVILTVHYRDMCLHRQVHNTRTLVTHTDGSTHTITLQSRR